LSGKRQIFYVACKKTDRRYSWKITSLFSKTFHQIIEENLINFRMPLEKFTGQQACTATDFKDSLK